MSRMPRRLLIGLVGIASIALADEWSKHFQISGRADLRVNANDGSVTIRTWDRKEIEARVTTVQWRIPSDVEVIDHQNGDRVDLELRMPRHNFMINFGRRSIQLELRVPRELRSDIHTGDGSIVVEDLHGETRLSTGDGRIEAEVNNGSRMTSEWNVRTGDGHVTLRLPDNFSADLDVHTGDGHIQSDLPVTISGSRHEHELRGKLNAGGPPLIVRTNDGSIRLERM